MYKPIKIKLFLEDELPKQIIKGGTINDNLISNNRYKYLRAENRIETFIHGASKIESEVKLWFEFDNSENINKDGDLSYMERTDKSISFIIKQLVNYSNVKVKNFKKNTLVLKLFDLKNKTFDKYLEEWRTNVEIFGNSIIDIFAYGELFTKTEEKICDYIITKKYSNYLSLLKLDYTYTIKYIYKIINFLQICDKKDIIFRDWKFSRFGFQYVNSEIEFVILDYEDNLLLKKTDIFFDKYKDGCDAMCVGTLVPYFIISDFFEMERAWKHKLDKLYSVGLAETLIFLLYEQNETMDSILKFIYNPSLLKPCLHYYKFMKIFDNENEKNSFYKLITNLKPKFVEIEPKINYMFIRIIQNCFEKKYSDIKTPDTYLEILNQTYNDFIREKSEIKISIKPIGFDPTKKLILPIIKKNFKTKIY